ncbi:globin [Iamia sp. SCSIO 61187]|uniref:globin domain-containing protein n=1 Tax=Iamia sp. SCSIO 61187 TaxID=2722752 RepID=UPI001C626651|nr:globin [Iamia sp. SCSIO 61187]QYG93337.1 globin [Iamia sp. SCSIO 61187]
MQVGVPDPSGGRLPTVFDAVGGRDFFDRVVDRFYDAVETDPLLRPLYPEDLTESRRHTAGFFAQYWGGGTVQYSDERGHPRLRMRHMPFAITEAHAAAWLHHMRAALAAEPDLPDEVRQAMDDHITNAAVMLVNS